MSSIVTTTYTFRETKDVYYLRNNSTTLLTYTLNRKNCSTNQTDRVEQVSLIPNEERQLTFTGDGEYTLLIGTNIVSATICIPYYLNLVNRVICDIKIAVCATCKPCETFIEDCVPQEAKDAIAYQTLLNTLLTTKFFVRPFAITTCPPITTIDRFLNNAADFYNCTIFTELCNTYLSTSITGIAKFSSTLFKRYVALYYLGFYFYENLLAENSEELQYVREKYNWTTISSCITKLGISISDMETVFNDNLITANTPPTVNNRDIILSPVTNTWNYTFSSLDFTDGFQDAQGDNANQVKLRTLPALGTLTFNGTPVIGIDFTFPIAQANLLVYNVTATIVADVIDVIYFQISDDNNNPLFSDLARVNFNIRQAVNQPPTSVAPITFNLVEGQETVLTAAQFISAFVDPENDDIANIRITIPTAIPVTVRVNAIVVNSGDVIPFSDVLAGNLTAQPNSGISVLPATYSIQYEASDTGTGTFVG